MAMVVNHNIPALTTYNTVNATSSALAKSIAKLSTGLRINSAADDAAGLAISEKMRAQIAGLNQAISNSQDGISLLQTAEGALSETHSILQRMRELSVQAANDTLTQQDRSYIQLEIDELRDEITNIGNTTQFNTKKLLNGDAAVLWSADKTATKAIINGGLRKIDDYGQKKSVEGNYKITVNATAGDTQVQKSDIMKVKHDLSPSTINAKSDTVENVETINAVVALERAGRADAADGTSLFATADKSGIDTTSKSSTVVTAEGTSTRAGQMYASVVSIDGITESKIGTFAMVSGSESITFKVAGKDYTVLASDVKTAAQNRLGTAPTQASDIKAADLVVAINGKLEGKAAASYESTTLGSDPLSVKLIITSSDFTAADDTLNANISKLQSDVVVNKEIKEISELYTNTIETGLDGDNLNALLTNSGGLAAGKYATLTVKVSGVDYTVKIVEDSTTDEKGTIDGTTVSYTAGGATAAEKKSALNTLANAFNAKLGGAALAEIKNGKLVFTSTTLEKDTGMALDTDTDGGIAVATVSGFSGTVDSKSQDKVYDTSITISGLTAADLTNAKDNSGIVSVTLGDKEYRVNRALINAESSQGAAAVASALNKVLGSAGIASANGNDITIKALAVRQTKVDDDVEAFFASSSDSGHATPVKTEAKVLKTDFIKMSTISGSGGRGGVFSVTVDGKEYKATMATNYSNDTAVKTALEGAVDDEGNTLSSVADIAFSSSGTDCVLTITQKSANVPTVSNDEEPIVIDAVKFSSYANVLTLDGLSTEVINEFKNSDDGVIAISVGGKNVEVKKGDVASAFAISDIANAIGTKLGATVATATSSGEKIIITAVDHSAPATPMSGSLKTAPVDSNPNVIMMEIGEENADTFVENSDPSKSKLTVTVGGQEITVSTEAAAAASGDTSMEKIKNALQDELDKQGLGKAEANGGTLTITAADDRENVAQAMADGSKMTVKTAGEGEFKNMLTLKKLTDEKIADFVKGNGTLTIKGMKDVNGDEIAPITLKGSEVGGDTVDAFVAALENKVSPHGIKVVRTPSEDAATPTTRDAGVEEDVTLVGPYTMGMEKDNMSAMMDFKENGGGTIGDVATSSNSVRDIDKFWNTEGKFMITDPQTITINQGDGRKASVTIYGTDSLGEVATKLNDAIADQLGQKEYVDDPTKFVVFVDDATADPTTESVKGTFVISSALAGAAGELSFSGDENLINAFSLNEIKGASESTYIVDVEDAHSGDKIAEGVKITGNKLVGIVNENVDVEFDPMAGLKAEWNEDSKEFDLKASQYVTTLHLADNTTVFQVGANEGEDMAVHIGDMRSQALGLNKVNVTNRQSAARSISVIDNAIDKVSTQRAKIGAYQNRLEHKITNLTTSYENLSSAESRIRDTDMAKEMMNFMKLQIASQAGTSMLAQANQLTQNVLSLIR